MQQREALSAYMDGYDVKAELTEILCQDADLQQKWSNYHTIRSVMRNEPLILGADFSEKMAKLLEDEKIEPISYKKGRLLKLKNWGMPMMQAGIAASVCLITVLSVNYFNHQESMAQSKQTVLQTMPFSNSIESVSYSTQTKTQPKDDSTNPPTLNGKADEKNERDEK